MADENDLCIKIEPPKIPSISLLGGAEIMGMVDFSLGTPTDCKLVFSLLLQLSPLLASMACLLKILNVIGKLEGFVGEVAPPTPKLPGALKELLDAITDLKGCIPIFVPVQMVLMLKGMLQLVISFLFCFIDQLESIVTFQVNLEVNLEGAKGNPVLLDSLICARNNAQASMETLVLSLSPIQPILMAVTAVASIADQPITLPDLSTISSSQDPTQTVTSIRQAIASMQQTIDALPG